MTINKKLEVIEEAFNYYHDRTSLTNKEEKELLNLVNELYEAISVTRCCDKLPQDPIELARYLHEAYEMIAKKQNWNTQENCKVDFSDLPVGNKNTMILLAGKLILDFGGN